MRRATSGITPLPCLLFGGEHHRVPAIFGGRNGAVAIGTGAAADVAAVNVVASIAAAAVVWSVITFVMVLSPLSISMASS